MHDDAAIVHPTQAETRARAEAAAKAKEEQTRRAEAARAAAAEAAAKAKAEQARRAEAARAAAAEAAAKAKEEQARRAEAARAAAAEAARKKQVRRDCSGSVLLVTYACCAVTHAVTHAHPPLVLVWLHRAAGKHKCTHRHAPTARLSCTLQQHPPPPLPRDRALQFSCILVSS
jgi:hypothetical protein